MRVAIFLLSIFLATAGAASANEPGKIIVLAHSSKNNASNPSGAMALAFKQRLETLSRDAIRVDVFPEGQLGTDAQAVALARNGVIQSAISSTAGILDIFSLVVVLDFPFAHKSIEDAYRVFDGPFGQQFSDHLRHDTGLAVLGYGDPGGLSVLTNSKHPVRGPADMAGLRIRAAGTQAQKTFVRSLGAEPVEIERRELFEALQKRILDGQMDTVPAVRASRFDDVQKYLTLTNHAFSPALWVVNASFFAQLSAEERAWVEEAAKVGVAASRKVAFEMVASEEGLPALTRRMKVYRPTTTEIEAFRQATQPAMQQLISDTFGKEGTDLLLAFLDAIESSRGPGRTAAFPAH